MPHWCAIRVGRLIEATVEGAYRTAADIDPHFDAVYAAMMTSPSPRLIIVADWRRCHVMSAEASERTIVRFAQNNAAVERSAILASRFAPLAVLQLMRLLQAAKHPDRMIFYDATYLVAWLKDSLTPAEYYRLRQFLSEVMGDPATTAGAGIVVQRPILGATTTGRPAPPGRLEGSDAPHSRQAR